MAKSDLQEGTITNTGTVQKDGTIKPFPSFTTADKLPKEKQEKLDAVMKDYDDNVTVPQVVEVVHHATKEEKISLIKAKVAANATQVEFELLMHISVVHDLDPLLKEIWLVKFGDSPAQIYVGRDGYLKIAHRSGQFDGMKTVVHFDELGKPVNAICTVWRKDMTHPIESDVLFKEYTTGKNLWATKPAVMIGKVAESVALRKAFSVSGVYSPEEVGS